MASDIGLRRKYLHYNRKLFNGSLPQNTELWYETSANLAIVTCDGNALKFDESTDTYLIRINPIIAWSHRLINGALLHEMAHIAVGFNVNHGKAFQDEMKRLASINAFRSIW